MKNLVMLGVVVVLMQTTCVSAALTNVALQSNGGIATAISEGSYNGYHAAASQVNNGDYGGLSFWASNGSMPAWVQVQFDKSYLIERVATQVDYHQQMYSLSLSSDGTNWTTVVDNHLSANVPTSVPTNASAGSTYETFDITPMSSQYIRMDVTSTTAPGSHIFQAMVNELEAYSSPENTASQVPTPGAFLLGALGTSVTYWMRKRRAI